MAQEATAVYIIYSIWECMQYASSLITLFPGDELNSGTNAGPSMAGFETGLRSEYLEPGESIEAIIEDIGTLVYEIGAGEEPPSNLSGAQLPPMDSLRIN